jgi:hypothetical protein
LNISYVKRHEVDTRKWDECIAGSVNGMVYAYSWYLDIVAHGWDALVADDYQSVFPLVHNVKFGIHYLYQPYFTQQLGLFSTGHITPELVSRFLDAIPAKFKYISIQLNTYLRVDYPSAKVIGRITHHLDLIETYPVLSGRYSTNTKRNISRAVAHGITISKGVTPMQMLDLKRESLIVPLKKKQFQMLTRIMTQSLERGVGQLLGAYTQRNELCASAFFLISNGKAIYLLASSGKEGLEQRAMFALVDHFINLHSETPLILDFEGSDIESIARFYKGFGATPCEYNRLVINRLPLILKIFRR